MNLALGVLEEMILLILLMKEETYGVEIAKEYHARLDQQISIPAIHVVLKRLDKKGLVTSRLGEPTAERGGRSKRLYSATNKGYAAARELQDKRAAMWESIPNIKLTFSGT